VKIGKILVKVENWIGVIHAIFWGEMLIRYCIHSYSHTCTYLNSRCNGG